MRPETAVARYLDAWEFAARGHAEPGSWGRAPFVTISRQAGAGGHSLAEALLAEFARRGGSVWGGWQIFNQTLVRLFSQSPRLKAGLKAVLAEDYDSRVHDYIRQLLVGSAPQDFVVSRVFHTVRSLAALGKVIIVGRAAVCVTGDLSGGVHVRLVAARSSRVGNLRRKLSLSADQAEKKLDALEASRTALVYNHFRRDPADPLLYDAVFNTDRVSFPEIASWVCGRLEEKARALQASQRAASRA